MSLGLCEPEHLIGVGAYPVSVVWGSLTFKYTLDRTLVDPGHCPQSISLMLVPSRDAAGPIFTIVGMTRPGIKLLPSTGQKLTTRLQTLSYNTVNAKQVVSACSWEDIGINLFMISNTQTSACTNTNTLKSSILALGQTVEPGPEGC
jgi:hypothetical protein